MAWTIKGPIFINPSAYLSFICYSNKLWIDMQPADFLVGHLEGWYGLFQD